MAFSEPDTSGINFYPYARKLRVVLHLFFNEAVHTA